MKVALFIHAFPGVESTLARHWPYYKRAGWDIFGVGRENSAIQWPESMLTKDIGPNGYIDNGKLPERLVETYRWFLTDYRFHEYSHAAVIEYDSIFTAAPRLVDVPFMVGANLAGHRHGNFKAEHFYHNPWILSVIGAKMFVTKADELLAKGEREFGHPDLFFGLVWQELGAPVRHLDWTFSRNTIESEEDQTMARERILSGKVIFCHGIKTEAQLKAVVP